MYLKKNRWLPRKNKHSSYSLTSTYIHKHEHTHTLDQAVFPQVFLNQFSQLTFCLYVLNFGEFRTHNLKYHIASCSYHLSSAIPIACNAHTRILIFLFSSFIPDFGIKKDCRRCFKVQCTGLLLRQISTPSSSFHPL